MTLSGPIPDSVREFIATYIGSVVQLETLLLLVRSRKPWTASEVARELRIEIEGAAAQLWELAQNGLLVSMNSSKEPRFQLAPAALRLEEVMQQLAHSYEDRRVTVISLIYSKPSDTIRVFADAFRLRKGDNEDG
jgi:hypothetical protein